MVEPNLILFDSGNTFKSRFHPLFFMDSRSWAAFLLTGILLLSGCFGGIETNEDEISNDETTVKTVVLSAEWDVNPDTIALDGTSVLYTIMVENVGDEWAAEQTIISPRISLVDT